MPSAPSCFSELSAFAPYAPSCLRVLRGQERGFALVTAPDHVRNELLQLNNILFREKNLIIEEA